MHKKPYLIRILLAAVLVCAAIYGMLPLRDQPFSRYILRAATREKQEFAQLVQRAQTMVNSGKAKSLFLAIRETACKDGIDLSKYFSSKNVADIKNLEEKNGVLLNALLAESKAKIKQGLDLKGGVSFVLQVSDPKFDNFKAIDKRDQLSKSIDIIRQRIDGLGVSEPIVRIFENNAIEIQLPGVSTKENPELVDIIKKPAKLEFRLLHPTLSPKSRSEHPPIGYEILAMNSGKASDDKDQELAFVKKIPEMTGRMIKRAGVAVGQYGEYEISLAMTEEGTKLFDKITSNNINKRLGIVLDGKLYSAPVIRTAIPNGHASISGSFSQREAFELANILNNPLEVELKFVELNEIGPSLAEDARISSIKASIIGAAVVAAFMLLYYRVAGIVSLISVAANVVIVLGIMAAIGATLTLPGIAALVLTIGMAVDANILIFERMREELVLGKSLEAALQAGHTKAFSSIFDANLTTLLTAVTLIYFGTGPIKGFGVILSIGIVATMFCALVLSRGLLELIISKNLAQKLIPDFRFKPIEFNFLKNSRFVGGIYLAIFIIGAAVIIGKNSKIYGIDFTGGDEITLKFQKKIPINEINKVASEKNLGEVVSLYQKSISDDSEILRVQTSIGNGLELFNGLNKRFEDANLSLIKKTEIGASVGQNIKLNALIAVGMAMIGIMLYIAFRFEMSYGIGAIISTLVNVVVTVTLYLALGCQISAPMIAAILMVVGYAINDTIIIFDRIREELRLNKTKNLAAVVNLSINKTLSRTILTSSSTFLAALALHLFGSGVIIDFSLVFLIGVALGTFASIFIASPIFYWYSSKNPVPTVAEVAQ